MRRRACSNRGFVLLMVLVALIVVGVTLTQASRASLRLSIAALNHQARLQRKWGQVSCERAVLPVASGVFNRVNATGANEFGVTEAGANEAEPFASKPNVDPVTVLRDRIVLGRQSFDIVLADEDAKANLNTMYHATGLSVVKRELQRGLPAGDARAVAARPRVESLQTQMKRQARPTAVVVTEAPRAFRSWGDVFSIPAVRELAGDDRQLVAMTRDWTIHGRGPMNVLRAGNSAKLALLRSVVEDGLAKRVIDEIQRSSTTDLPLILERVVTDGRDRDQLLQMLTTFSGTFSMWIEVTSDKSREQSLAVISTDGTGLTKTSRFVF